MKKSLLQRMRIQSSKFVQNIPKKLMNMVVWIISKILKTFGISYGKNLFTKLIPIKNILSWLLGVLVLFFPALAPIIGIGKVLL